MDAYVDGAGVAATWFPQFPQVGSRTEWNRTH